MYSQISQGSIVLPISSNSASVIPTTPSTYCAKLSPSLLPNPHSSASLIVLYARYIGTMGLDTKEYTLYTNKLPDGFDGLKVVHFSDIHYNRAIALDKIDMMVDEINLINPDIVVFTGDLIDKDTEMNETISKEISDLLSKIKVTVGAYAIDGNHDKYFSEWKTHKKIC